MVKTTPFALGWRPIGSMSRRWQTQVCADVAEAARVAAGLAGLDGGGRWRVYSLAHVPGQRGSVRLERRALLAEGVVRPGGA